MSDHSWCRDIPRDEAVRAAEDGRQGPLPTLEGAIAAVTERRPPEPRVCGNLTGLRTERVTLEVKHFSTLHAHMWGWDVFAEPVLRPGESVRVVDDQRESHMEAQRGVIDTLTRHRDAVIQRADRDSVKCSALADTVIALRARVAKLEADNKWLAELVEERRWIPASEQPAPAPPFADGPKRSPAVSKSGEGQSGMRTERVVLEVTHDCKYSALEWVLEEVRESCCDPGESVRVVEESHFDDLANVAMERDAAIRERDAAKSDAEKSAVRIKSQAENVAYFRRDRDETVLERDAAIRERDKLRGEITSVLDRSEFASTELTRLRNRVAQLESAAKLAPAANADAVSNPQPISGAGKSAGEETQAASGVAERIAAELLRSGGLADTVQRLEAMSQDSGRTVLWEEFDANEDGSVDKVNEVAPAASGAANSEIRDGGIHSTPARPPGGWRRG